MLAVMPVEENRLLLPPMDTPMPTVTIEQVIQFWEESRSLPRLLWQPTFGGAMVTHDMALLYYSVNFPISRAKARCSRGRRWRRCGVPICGPPMATRQATGSATAL